WCLRPAVMRETMRAPTRNGRETASARVASAEPFHPTTTASPTLVGGVEGANNTGRPELINVCSITSVCGWFTTRSDRPSTIRSKNRPLCETRAGDYTAWSCHAGDAPIFTGDCWDGARLCRI